MPESRPLTKRRKILFGVFTILIVLATVEVGLHLINFAVSRSKPDRGKSPILTFYEGKEWAPTLARESEKPHRQQEYHQYLTWISKPVRGQFVNIDRSEGRKTWNPEDLKADAVRRVFFFGGSAAWGHGARDHHTIASELARLLNRDQPRFRVYNYGEPAYTFTQGLLYLIMKLQDGQVPQYVIFYDGFNDIYGSYQSGRAGTLHNVALTQEKLQTKPGRQARKAAGEWLKENFFLYNKIFYKIYLYFRPAAKYREQAAGYGDEELKALAAETVRYYDRSLKILDALSRAYGFKYACFWQPALFTEAKPVAGEARRDVRLGDRKLAQLYRLTNEELLRQNLPQVFIIADAAGARTRPVYLDLVHMTEEGYSLVAQRIYQVLPGEWLRGQ
jgi:lysophospholipase L1-like esterase